MHKWFGYQQLIKHKSCLTTTNHLRIYKYLPCGCGVKSNEIHVQFVIKQTKYHCLDRGGYCILSAISLINIQSLSQKMIIRMFIFSNLAKMHKNHNSIIRSCGRISASHRQHHSNIVHQG